MVISQMYPGYDIYGYDSYDITNISLLYGYDMYHL